MESAYNERNWRNGARCIGMPLSDFFLDGNYENPINLAWVNEARAICAGCAVVALCLQDALEMDETKEGIRGGLTPKERRKLNRQSTNTHSAA